MQKKKEGYKFFFNVSENKKIDLFFFTQIIYQPIIFIYFFYMSSVLNLENLNALVKDCNTDNKYELYRNVIETCKNIVIEEYVDSINDILLKYKRMGQFFNFNNFSNDISNISDHYVKLLERALWYYLKLLGPFEEEMDSFCNRYKIMTGNSLKTYKDKMINFRNHDLFRYEIDEVLSNMKLIFQQIVGDFI